jgi:MFS family permease
VIGPILTFSLIGRRHLAVPMIAAAIGWALVLALLGAWPTAIGAFVLLAVGGSARSVLDVSGRTILLRAAPDVSRGTVFGMLEGVSMLGLAMGSILVPALVALDGAGTALIATGVLLSGIALAQAARLHGVDRTSAPLTA